MASKRDFKAFWAFIFQNFLLSMAVGSAYIFFRGHTPLEFLFVCVALVSNTVMLYAAISLLAFPFYLVPGQKWILGVLLWLFQLALVTDAGVYKIFHFHLNSMVWNLLTTPGGLASLDQGWEMKGLFLALAALLLAAQWIFWRLAPSAAGRLFARPKLARLSLSVLLLFVVADKGMFAWGTLYDTVPIIRNDQLFPLYQPLKVRSFANKYLGFRLSAPVRMDLPSGASDLDYPQKPLVIVQPKKPLNILILVVDSMRYDMYRPDILPNTWALGQKGTAFMSHYSGGDCTRFGIFSLIYGLYGNYWFPMLGERREPVLMDALLKEGYDFRLFAASALSFPEFNKTCFVDVPRADIYDKPRPGNGAVRDDDITDKAVDFIKNRKSGKPYFGFVFFDASHGSYDYTPQYEMFKPAHFVNLLLLNKSNILPLFNKYKNAVHFDDHEIGRILKAVRASGGMKDTVIVVTGDHGEPFFEKGYYGHNQSYSAEEVRVPFVFYEPGRKPSVVTYDTSHFDLAPTLLPLLGVKNPASDYSSGHGLFSPERWPFMPVFSWDTAAIVRKDDTMVLPLQAYKGGLKVMDNATWKEKGEKAEAPFMPLLSSFQKEASRFLR